jgi:SAM-dependent methyltransferase
VSYPERIVPDETDPGIVALHLKRYAFALPWCRDREVLDAACGVGYGSAFLAERGARHVLGLDVSEEAVAYARSRYAGPGVEFHVADLQELDLPERSLDAVCSFETIEHLDEPERFVERAARALRPEGAFVASTPRVNVTTRSPDNPFHRIELARGDFEQLLRRSFEEVELFGQRRVQTRRHRLMQRADVLGLRRRVPALRPASRLLGTAPMAEVGFDGIVIAADGLERATELVAVCTRPRA